MSKRGKKYTLPSCPTYSAICHAKNETNIRKQYKKDYGLLGSKYPNPLCNDNTMYPSHLYATHHLDFSNPCNKKKKKVVRKKYTERKSNKVVYLFRIGHKIADGLTPFRQTYASSRPNTTLY